MKHFYIVKGNLLAEPPFILSWTKQRCKLADKATCIWNRRTCRMSASFATTYISSACPVPIAAATFHAGTLFFLFVINGNNLPQSAVSCKCKNVASHDISVCRNAVYCHMRATIMQCVLGSMKSCLEVLVASTSPNTKECQLPQSVVPTCFFLR